MSQKRRDTQVRVRMMTRNLMSLHRAKGQEHLEPFQNLNVAISLPVCILLLSARSKLQNAEAVGYSMK